MVVLAFDESLFNTRDEEDAAIRRLLEGVLGRRVCIPLLIPQRAEDFQVQAVELTLHFLQVGGVLAPLAQQTLLLLLQ